MSRQILRLLPLLLLLPARSSSLSPELVWMLSWSDHRMAVLATVPASSRIECGVRCARDEGCSAAAYNSSSAPLTCHLLACEEGWHHFDGNCYRLVTEARDWLNALFACLVNRRAEIASILSEEENTFIKTLADSNGIERLYMGLQRESSGDFAWTDQSPFSYINWADGEGNDTPNIWTGNVPIVGSMMASQGGQWADNAMNVEYPFVCKRTKVFP